MKKKLFSLMGIVSVMAIAMVSLVACGGPSLESMMGEDGSIDIGKLKSDTVTKEEWDSATASTIFDSDFSCYLSQSSAEYSSSMKLILDRDKLMMEVKMTSDGEEDYIQINYINFLADGKGDMYSNTEDDVWEKHEMEMSKEDIGEEFLITNLKGMFDNFEFNKDENCYKSKDGITEFEDANVSVIFKDGKVVYVKSTAVEPGEGELPTEMICSYDDATVELPIIA